MSENSSAVEKARLTDADFELLLPGSPLTIGKTDIVIRPLGIGELKDILARVNVIGSGLRDEGITASNYTEAEQILKLVTLIMDKAPAILSDAAKIALEDLVRLPLAINAQILEKVLEVNIESQEGLEKNLQRLADMIGRIRGAEVPAPTQPEL